MESMLEGTGLTSLDIYQDPQAALKNQMGTFDEVDIHKACARAQVKDYETVTITSISHQIGRKLKEQAKTASPPGINISPSVDPSTTSGITCDTAEYNGVS